MSFIYTNKGLKSYFLGTNSSDSIKEFNLHKDYTGLDSVYYSPYKTEIVQSSKSYRFKAEASKEYWVKFLVVCPSGMDTIATDGDILWGFYPDNTSAGIYIAREDAYSNRFYLYGTSGSKLSNDYIQLDFTTVTAKDSITDYLVCPYNEISIHIKSDSVNGSVDVYNGIRKVLEYTGNVFDGSDINYISFGGSGKDTPTPENSASYSGLIISTASDNMINVRIPYTDPNLKEVFDSTWTTLYADDGQTITGYKTEAVSSSFDIVLSNTTIDTDNEAANGVDSIIIPVSGTFINDADKTITGLNVYGIHIVDGVETSKTLLDTISFSEDGSFYKQVRLTTNPFNSKPFTSADLAAIKLRVETAKIL
jgi:hypothetical protein